MADSINKQICRRISKDMGMPYEEVYSITKSSTHYVKHVMENSGFETVKIPYLGKFSVNPYRLKLFNENKVKSKGYGFI